MIRETISADTSVLETIQSDSLVSPWPELLDTAIQAQGLELNGPHCLVATSPASNTPVGYVLAVDGLPEETADRKRDGTKSQCYVAEIAVAPGHRREGYGSSLLEAIAERTDADEILLTARAEEDPVRAFYNANGFEVIDRLSAYYDSGNGSQDGLLLSKRV